jgi:hypothetical protein
MAGLDPLVIKSVASVVMVGLDPTIQLFLGPRVKPEDDRRGRRRTTRKRTAEDDREGRG